MSAESTAPSTEVTFCLYIAGGAVNSTKARGNLRATLEELGLNLEIVEIVDVFVEPERALEQGIIMTPMLVRTGPGSARRLVGTLDDADVLRSVLLHD